MYFGHKHVDTVPNCSYELATFLKYHMPLRIGKKVQWIYPFEFNTGNSVVWFSVNALNPKILIIGLETNKHHDSKKLYYCRNISRVNKQLSKKTWNIFSIRYTR